MTRHVLRDDAITPAEQTQLLELAERLKHDRFAMRPLEGPKTVAVVFDKTSTRTRVSFHVGISDLGGSPLIIDRGDSQLGDKESVADTARVLERMVEAIVWRTYAQAELEEMAAHSSVPVINALSDEFHPCQILADLLTLREEFGDVKGRSLVFLGDGASNMANSYLLGCATAGMNVTVCAPEGYQPSAAIVEDATRIAKETGATVRVSDSIERSVPGAHAVVTDTWVSMGDEDEREQRIGDLQGYAVTEETMRLAEPDAVFLHCLPAYRGCEVSAEVIDGPASRVWVEAENRVHAQKALLAWCLNAID